jgi:Flp pilus assembly pilin Flp
MYTGQFQATTSSGSQRDTPVSEMSQITDKIRQPRSSPMSGLGEKPVPRERGYGMKLFTRFLRDEHGMVMSAEMVMLGTVGVLAMTAGIGVMTTAVNDELTEMGQAFRSFNQNFEVVGYQSSYSGGVGRGGGGRGRASMSKGGSSFQQKVDSIQAAEDVRMEYMPTRRRQEKMHDDAEEASMSAQRMFQDGALKAAEVQSVQSLLFQQQALNQRLKENAKALRKIADQEEALKK